MLQRFMSRRCSKNEEARQADWERQLLNSCNVGSLVSGDPRPLHRVRKRDLHGEKPYIRRSTKRYQYMRFHMPQRTHPTRLMVPEDALAGHSHRPPSVMCDDCAFSGCFSLVRRLLLVLSLHVTSCQRTCFVPRIGIARNAMPRSEYFDNRSFYHNHGGLNAWFTTE
jgi:hypothetical protein